jgi:SAM-dependent methyltransferase
MNTENLRNRHMMSRENDSPDREFYGRPRLVPHLDLKALHTLRFLLEELLSDGSDRILDLMCGSDSHLGTRHGRVVGLGLNRGEILANASLSSGLLFDVNQGFGLPFRENSFDAVVNCLSIAYATDPIFLFEEVARVLRPGGVFVVIFSNRYFEPKATRLWKESDEHERLEIVQELFGTVGMFEPPHDFSSMGQPRPESDKYFESGLPSDPVFAVWARIKGGQTVEPIELRDPWAPEPLPAEELEWKISRLSKTLECPYCDHPLRKLMIPNSPFSNWDTAFMWICYNDDCPYLVRGWKTMFEQGNCGVSYRLLFHPVRHRCSSIPVHSLRELTDSVV